MIAASEPGEARWTVDELARRSGLTSRTIRAHQSGGLLPPPRLDGRTGYYGSAHLRRLGVITRLQGRGYSLAAIADLLAAWDDGRTLGELLGLEPGTAPAAPAGGEAPGTAAPAGGDDWVDDLFAAAVAPSEPAALLPAGMWN